MVKIHHCNHFPGNLAVWRPITHWHFLGLWTGLSDFSFGLNLRGYVSFHAHTRALATEVSLLPVLVYGKSCHRICGRTWTTSMHWKGILRL